MKRRLSATLVAAALAVGGAVLTAQPAAADVPCTVSGYSPQTVVVGLSQVVRQFSVTVSDCATLNSWSLFGYGDPGYGTTALLWENDRAPYEYFSAAWLYNADAGFRWDVEVDAHNGDSLATVQAFPSSFVLKRATAISSFDASPEPVTKGRPITVKGLLRSADWEQAKYVPLRYAPVRVQFKAVGSPTWTTVKTVKSSSTGWVTTTVTASVDGYWRLSYAGNFKFGSRTTGSDYVNVS